MRDIVGKSHCQIRQGEYLSEMTEKRPVRRLSTHLVGSLIGAV